MATDDLLQLDQQFCFAVYSASRALTRTYAPLLEPLGLTYPQYLVLLALWSKDGISVKELGAQLALDSATLTPLLKRLAARNILDRRRDAADERVVRIFLTPEGKALRTKAKKIPIELACRAGFDPSDVNAINKLVRLRKDLVALTQRLEANEVGAADEE